MKMMKQKLYVKIVPLLTLAVGSGLAAVSTKSVW